MALSVLQENNAEIGENIFVRIMQNKIDRRELMR
jgi:hypothetical protein